MMPLAIEVLALKLLISFLGLPISYLYYIVGEKQFTTIKFKNCVGAWHQVTNPGALREIKMSVVAAAEAVFTAPYVLGFIRWFSLVLINQVVNGLAIYFDIHKAIFDNESNGNVCNSNLIWITMNQNS